MNQLSTASVIIGIILLLAIIIFQPSPTTADPEPEKTEQPCIRKEKIWIPGEHRMVRKWWINGQPYLVRGNEILGRFGRFYDEDLNRR